MTIKRTIVKSCCGGSGGSVMLYLDRPITRNHLQIFKDNGYTIPPHYENQGILYLRKDTLVATASFGMTKINVKVGQHNREQQLTAFEQLLEEALKN